MKLHEWILLCFVKPWKYHTTFLVQIHFLTQLFYRSCQICRVEKYNNLILYNWIISCILQCKLNFIQNYTEKVNKLFTCIFFFQLYRGIYTKNIVELPSNLKKLIQLKLSNFQVQNLQKSRNFATEGTCRGFFKSPV